MANGNDPRPSFIDRLLATVPGARTWFDPELSEGEQQLIDDFNEQSQTDVDLWRQSRLADTPGVHYENTQSGLQLIKDFFTGEEKRRPAVALGPDRFDNWLMSAIERDQHGNRTLRSVGDVFADKRFVLGHELGHEVDTQSGRESKFNIYKRTREYTKDVSKTHTKQAREIDKILSELGGDQYDLRQAQKRTDDYQLFADDVSRALIAEQDNKETSKFIEAIGQFIDKTLADPKK